MQKNQICGVIYKSNNWILQLNDLIKISASDNTVYIKSSEYLWPLTKLRCLCYPHLDTESLSEMLDNSEKHALTHSQKKN